MSYQSIRCSSAQTCLSISLVAVVVQDRSDDLRARLVVAGEEKVVDGSPFRVSHRKWLGDVLESANVLQAVTKCRHEIDVLHFLHLLAEQSRFTSKCRLSPRFVSPETTHL